MHLFCSNEDTGYIITSSYLCLLCSRFTIFVCSRTRGTCASQLGFGNVWYGLVLGAGKDTRILSRCIQGGTSIFGDPVSESPSVHPKNRTYKTYGWRANMEAEFGIPVGRLTRRPPGLKIDSSARRNMKNTKPESKEDCLQVQLPNGQGIGCAPS